MENKKIKKKVIELIYDSTLQYCAKLENISDWLRDNQLKDKLAECLNNKVFTH